jgi:TP901 family phage tail tape measure protein
VAVGSHELLLVLRARDEASRVLRSFGSAFTELDNAGRKAASNQIAAGAALTSVAVGLGAVAMASIGFMSDAAAEAKEFEQGITLVRTQQDKLKNSTKELGDIVKGVAKDIAVPLDTLDEGLFDIFSSMDVNITQAEKLLREFSKSAVAGATDLQTAGRATIAIMNAWHIPAEQVTKVLDVQFQLVRKGVGTYEEFASTIGRAIPSAQRAGQSIETLAGMLAFLTRNGLSAAMASASAGRAFDAFANEKVVGRLEKMGIQVRDAGGEFRDMGGVILDLQKKLAKLTDPERAAALADLFQGAGGTIQARRFYDLVLKDAQSAEMFVGLVGDMSRASGEFTKAYDAMAGTAQNQTQVLKNQWEIFKVELGDALMPVLKEVLKVLQGLFEWWNNLGEGTKKTITYIFIGVTAFAALLAVILGIAGIFAMVSGMAALLGIAMGKLILIVLAVAAAIAVLVAIGYLIWKNWDTIKAALVAAWEWVWDKIGPVVKAIRDGIVSAFFWVRDKLVEFWDWLYAHFVGPMIELFVKMGDDISKAVRAVGDYITETWDRISEWTSSRWAGIKQVLEPFVNFLVEYFTPAFQMVWEVIKVAWQLIVDITKTTWDMMVSILETVLDWVVMTFQTAWDIIVGVVKAAWELIKGFIDFGISVIMGIIDIIVGVFTGDWSLAWEGVKTIFKAAWDLMLSILNTIWILIKDVIWNALKWVWDTIVAVFNIVKDVFMGFWGFVVDGFRACVDFVRAIWNGIMETTKAPINFVIRYVYNEGIRAVWNKIAGFLGLGTLPEAGLIGAVPNTGGGAAGVGAGGGGNFRFARGGVLDGYEPGIDSVFAMLSKGEGILVPEAVRGLGAGFVHWANSFFSKGRTGILGEKANHGVAAYADGGIVGTIMGLAGGMGEAITALFKDPIGYITSKVGNNQWVRGAAGLMNKAVDGIVSKVQAWFSSFGDMGATPTGAPLPGGAPFGWQAMWAIIKSQFPGASLNSSFRPGDPGYHGKGRAIDIGGPMGAINAWIAATYPYSTQLIYTPGVNLLNGRPFTYDAPTRADHYDHVHWAMDNGGILKPGWSSIFNGTGQPEKILTAYQWSLIERALARSLGEDGFGRLTAEEGRSITNNNTFYVYTTGDDPKGLALSLGRYLGEGTSR